jgi:pimeloyl-ACP methyl ester carboxylesterase
MTPKRVLFLGGNGHCAARLTISREAAAQQGFTIDDVSYPGFEGRPRVPHLDAFLDAVAATPSDAPLVYATGIGGLVALGLRARGQWRDRRLLLQAPVLWGLERRWMPRLMRRPFLRRLGTGLLSSAAFRARFVRRYFERPLAAPERSAFFDGYDSCTALPDFFAWMTPSWLRELEQRFAADRRALDGIDMWWGARDRVLTLQELRWTEAALGVSWPTRIFPTWGHYPMIDAPDDWAAAIAAVLDN